MERKKETKPLEETAEIPSSDSSPDEELLKGEERDKLYACLAQLPPDEQEIIRLKFGAELTNREIARMLGLSESNVGTKLYRTVRKLRDGFRESGNG